VAIHMPAMDPEATQTYAVPKLAPAVPTAGKVRKSSPAPTLKGVPMAKTVCPVCGTLPADKELCVSCAELAGKQVQPFAGYRIVRELGRGGMGVVFLALRQEDQTRVALKQIRPAVAGTRGQVDRFLREAEILKTLNHLHIVAFRDLGRGGDADELIYFAMEF